MSRFLIAIVFAVFAVPAAAQVAADIEWQDLAPSFDVRENPFYGLSLRESILLGKLVELEQAEGEGLTLSPFERRGRDLALKALDSVGLEGASLAQRVLAFDPLLEASRTETATALEGRVVRIAGFILPIEVEKQRITRFVLVPFAGACVHTPPPPPNQMVVVRAPAGVVVRGPFEAITVTGVLEIAPEAQTVIFTDGVAAIDTGYAMEANAVELL